MRKIGDILIEIGITPDLKGFGYILKAVDIVGKSDERMKLVEGVYREIAESERTTASGVERAIRHAISRADKQKYKEYLSTTKSTNSAFLYMLAYKTKNKTEEKK